MVRRNEGKGTDKMANLTYGDNVTIDTTKLPDKSCAALMQYGLSHFLGNVQASKVVSRIRSQIGSDADTAAVKAWREANKDQVAQWGAEFLQSALAELENGTIGVREGGPRKDPVEKKFEQLVVDYVRATLKARGMKLPKDDETIIDFGPHGTRTRSEMIANAKASQGDRLRKQAEKMIADEARLAAQAERWAAGVEQADPTALGL